MQLRDRRRAALDQHLHRSVGQVAGEAFEAEPLCLDARTVAKVNALNLAGYAKSAADLIHGVLGDGRLAKPADAGS